MSCYIDNIKALSRPPLPISLAKIKHYLRINHDADDEALKEFAQAAVEHLERHLGMAIMQRSWLIEYNNPQLSQELLSLGIAPVKSISSVTLQNGKNRTLLAVTDYFLCGDSKISIVPSIAALRLSIECVAGHAKSHSDLSLELATIVLRLIAAMYDGLEYDHILQAETVTQLHNYKL